MRTAGAIVLGLVVFAMSCAHAGTTGKVAGKVLDAQTGEPLVGVNVLLVGTTLGASSDIEGEYFILNIPPGTYAVKASAVGYGPVTVDAVRVTADQTTRVADLPEAGDSGDRGRRRDGDAPDGSEGPDIHDLVGERRRAAGASP